MDALNASELASVKEAFSNPANLGNNNDVEVQWAMKAMEHAEVHYNLISAVDAKKLRLTNVDNQIYEAFKAQFPDMDVSKIPEESLKTPEAKEKWRNFCENFKGVIKDYNMGTLLRLDCKEEYSPDNTTLSIRAQFLAIEIARNKQGLNTALSEKKAPAQAEETKEPENNTS